MSLLVSGIPAYQSYAEEGSRRTDHPLRFLHIDLVTQYDEWEVLGIVR